jgi:hypothetical protein
LRELLQDTSRLLVGDDLEGRTQTLAEDLADIYRSLFLKM